VTKTGSKTAGINVLRADNLNSLDWLVHGFSTRAGGFSKVYGQKTLNLGFTKLDERQTVEKNRAAFLKELGNGVASWPIINLRQVHSDLIHCVVKADEHPPGDGVITQTPGLLLAVQTADCVPVLLADSKQKAVGAFHAGWRGTVKRIVEKGVGEMHRYFGTNAANLRAAIGPCIHSCCYEVGEEVRDAYRSQFSYADELFREVRDSDPVKEKYPLLFMNARAPGHGPDEPKIFLDLVAANRQQLLDAGVRSRNISASDLCTSCRTDLLFSYRKEKDATGRLMAVIGLKS
jgi:YfiH family protein